MPKYTDFDLDVQTPESIIPSKGSIETIGKYDPTAMTYCYVCPINRTIDDILKTDLY